MSTRHRPTLRDVARLSDLSVTQTSRALNGHADVAPATRLRAEAAAQQLGYVPNQDARRLQNPRTRSGSLGLILVGSQRFSDPFFGTLLTNVVDEAARRGYEFQLSAPATDEDPTAAYERAILTNRVDGFVVLRTTRSDPRARFLAERSVPFVTFGRVETDTQPDGLRFPAVVEDPGCLAPAVDHLVEHGHVRFGFLHEPLENSIGADRLASFRRAMAAHGLQVDDRHIAPGGFRDDTARAAAMAILSRPDRPTALLTSNDLQAVGVLQAAGELGMTVPDDLSVVGFDDIAAVAHTSPPLTTLRHPDGAIARHLVERLLAAIDVESTTGPNDEIVLMPQLVVRRSTGSPPG